MPWFVYVLENEAGRHYVGSTGRSPQIRVDEHNAGLGLWTRAHRPWPLRYTERFATKQAALARERFLKRGLGRRRMRELLGSG